MRARLMLAACLFTSLTACPGPGFKYVVPANEPARMHTDEVQLDVKQVLNPWGSCLGVDVSVKNLTDHIVVFDPDDVTISVPAGGKTYKHTNKMRQTSHGNMLSEDLWQMPNVAFANPIPAGETYSAVIWFEVPYEQIDVGAIRVDYASQNVRLPRGSK